MAIPEVARVFGLRTSAIRYYEQAGILPRPQRKNGQRCYDTAVLYRLAVIRRARETGFTLAEIKQLFFGFQPRTSPAERWQLLSLKKTTELQKRIAQLKSMKRLLTRMESCRCDALDECGKKILRAEGLEQTITR